MRILTNLFSFYLIRALIVLFWLGCLALFLYSPYLGYFWPNQNSINVYTWADMVDIGQVRDFEMQTGIKVNLVYYDNSEELFAKLGITKGVGYDLLILNDSTVPSLIQEDLLAKIDHKQLNFWSDLEPKLLNQAYDLNNIYTLPYSWDIYGLGINLEYFENKLPQNSWGLIFDSQYHVKNIGMMEESLRAIDIAAQYLYGKPDNLDQAQILQVKKTLIDQKKNVSLYTELMGDYLLYSRSSPVVASQSAYVARVMEKDANIKFLIPQEGGFVSVECFAILKNSNNHGQIYQFINFMFSKKVLADFIQKTRFLPARQDLLQSLDLNYLGQDLAFLKKADYFRQIISRKELSNLWIEVKAS